MPSKDRPSASNTSSPTIESLSSQCVRGQIWGARVVTAEHSPESTGSASISCFAAGQKEFRERQEDQGDITTRGHGQAQCADTYLNTNLEKRRLAETHLDSARLLNVTAESHWERTGVQNGPL